MKKYLILGAAMVALVGTGCRKSKSIKEIFNIKKDVPHTENVPTGDSIWNKIPPGGGTVDLINRNLANQTFQYIKDYNAKPDYIIWVKIKDLSLKITAPENQTFDNIDTLRVYMSTKLVAEDLVAYKYEIPKGVKEVALDHPDKNLKGFFLEDSVRIRVNGVFNSKPDPNTAMSINSTFDLFANPLN
jgi:hypothetical protein